MPKTLSGALRMGIGPAKGRLSTSLQQGMGIMAVPIPTTTHKRSDMIEQISLIVPKMDSQIQTLVEEKRQWMQMIYEIEDDIERAAEEKLFNEWAYGVDGFMAVVWDAKDTVSLLNARTTRLEAPPPAASTPTETTSPSTTSKATAKLPKLQLPTFSGDYLQWDQFWQMFRVNVHESSLAKVEKFAYLRGQLLAPALDTIEGISVTDDNYDVAIAVLQARFERPPRQLISSYYSQLKRLNQASNKASDLQRTYDACEKVFRLLEKAGESMDNNQSLVLDVFSKYPQQVVELLFSHRNITATSTLGEVRKALFDHIKEVESLTEIFEELKPFTPTKSEKPPTSGSKVSDASSSSLSSALTSTVVPQKRAAAPNERRNSDNPKSNCYFCDGSHFNSECKSYATKEARLQRLVQLDRCTRCLSATHLVDGCRTPPKSITCFFCRQSGDHRSPLCPQRFSQATQQSAAMITADTNPNQTVQSVTPVSTLLNAGESSLLLTALTTVFNPGSGQKLQARLILDSGSHRTYVTEACAAALCLVGDRTDTINIATFGSKRTLTVESRQVQISIQQRDGSSKTLRANTTPIIAGGSILPDRLPSTAVKWLDAMRDELADDYSVKSGDVDILVGTDYFWGFITGPRITTTFGIHLVPSTLGLLLTGKYHDESDVSPATLMCLTETRSAIPGLDSVESKLPLGYPDVDDFWSLERIGITESPIEDDDAKALEQFDKSVYFENGRYHVSLPWKSDASELPTNYHLALGRFRSLAKRLAGHDSDIRSRYHKVIEDQLNLGIIEKVPSTEGVTVDHPVHYLPHHPVIRPGSATTKLRIVYDASSKSRKDQRSLNECLYRGPVILPDLCGILLRFRLNSVAVVADIEKAFLQIALQPNDRDVTRFMWFEDPTKDAVPGNIAIYRFCRVIFGVLSSPFLLGATVLRHLADWMTDAAELIRKNIYVDNVLVTLDDNQSVEEFYVEAKTIFKAAGMNLTQWSSNDPNIESNIPEEDRCRGHVVKVLGIEWDCQADTLSLKQSAVFNEQTVTVVSTKRTVLKCIASIYDPLGWFQPATLPAKCFLKNLWVQGCSWDEPLPSELSEKWTELHTDLKRIFDINFPRNVGKMNSESKIVVFCDASIEAYAAAAYLWTPSSNKYNSTLLFAKPRLAPKLRSGESVSIPRLELLALTIGARMGNFIRTALESELPVTIFSDSTCVLAWLNSAKLLPVFVRNRITEIKKLNNVEYRYVRSVDNPADLCTRGVSASEINECSSWWHGPEFLSDKKWLEESSWGPETEELSNQLNDDSTETVTLLGLQNFVAVEAPPSPEGDVTNPVVGIQAETYSSFRRLLRVTTICIKFIKRHVWNKLSDQSKLSEWGGVGRIMRNISDSDGVTATDLTSVKLLWVKTAQSEALGELKLCMSKSKMHPLMKQLNTKFDEGGIIRCVGRFEHADLPEATIRPILLPRNHIITRLIIREIHLRLFHSGIPHTLTQLRREYWLPRGRAVVRRELRKCGLCRKYKGSHFALPTMPPWPRERVARSKPFEFVGIDYLGPVNVSVRGESVKMWVCLITCLAVRAVHLEVVTDCSAQCFVDCISRFVARRGYPAQIISDNAPQFRIAKTLFDRAWHQTFSDEITTSYMANNGIKWRFTAELSPWQGGFYERLVGLVKQTFRSVVGRKLLKWDESITLIAEVEAIVNCRPLTYVYEDFESGFVLRPCDFLTDLPTSVPDIDQTQRLYGGEAEKNVVRYWKHKQQRLNRLWDYWKDEYLLSLRERGHLNHRGQSRASQNCPSTDEIVLVKNPGAPRGSWKLGRITKIITSNDDKVRSVEVQLPNRMVLRRSVSHIYPLEIEATVDNETNNNDEQTDNNEEQTTQQIADNNKVSDAQTTQQIENDDDAFSGFSESEVYGDTRLEHVLLTNPSLLHKTINKGLLNDAVKLSFECKEM